jgi:hypothetical protein
MRIDSKDKIRFFYFVEVTISNKFTLKKINKLFCCTRMLLNILTTSQVYCLQERPGETI